MKKKVFIISILIVTIILITYVLKINSQSDVLVSFYNETSINIEKLNIKFSNELNMTTVPTIDPNKKNSFKLNPNENFTEGSVKLVYYDVDGEEHQETVIGYVEKGQSVHSKVYIKSIDNKGVIEFSIKEGWFP